MTGTLLLFLLVFIPFGWFVWRMLRFTRDTVGDNSPLKVPRTYTVSCWQYFTSLHMFLSYILYVSCLTVVALPLVAKIPWDAAPLPLWVLFPLVGLVGLLLIGFFLHNLLLDLNYWQHTRNKTLHFYPDRRTVTLETPERTYELRREDVLGLESYSNHRHSRNVYMYYRLKLANGEELIFTDRSAGFGFILEYFGQLPHQAHYQRFPIIK
jgi:hypothetical protein